MRIWTKNIKENFKSVLNKNLSKLYDLFLYQKVTDTLERGFKVLQYVILLLKKDFDLKSPNSNKISQRKEIFLIHYFTYKSVSKLQINYKRIFDDKCNLQIEKQ